MATRRKAASKIIARHARTWGSAGAIRNAPKRSQRAKNATGTAGVFRKGKKLGVARKNKYR